MKCIVEMIDISFSTQNQAIVRGVSHRFEEGLATALIGPSGGGKSTALKLSAGLLVPTAGCVYFRGKDLAFMNRAQNLDFRRQSAFVFQDSALWANQDLAQNLDLPLRIHFPKMPKPDRDKRVKEVLHEVGYKRMLNIRPAGLSMGEQKLIAFARAMLCRPNLLFLDEWTESLDDNNANRLIDIVQSFKEAGGTVIFVCHDLRIIRTLADCAVVIAGGKISQKLNGEEVARGELLSEILRKE